MPTVITKLELKNFRCFENHTVDLPPKTLLVGRNNAGKSTCVEALRLVSLVSERLLSLSLQNPPDWIDLPLIARGVAPSLKNIEVHRLSIFHNYSDPPASISATFSNRARLDVHIGPDFAIHGVVYDTKGRPADTRKKISELNLPRVSILPQISPLEENEVKLSSDYVRSNLPTALASRHFRNQLHFLKQYFAPFKELVEATWPGIQIRRFDVPSITSPNDSFALIVRDGGFSAEAAWMGHGLQMWLQTMWFLARNTDSAAVILDEPDVYMHADLQRRLVRLLLRDPRQCIIATHSPEMLAEVDPESVVILEKARKHSRAATTSAAVQELLRTVGSVHNLSLARLSAYRRLLFVEGDDVYLLKKFQNVVAPNASTPIDLIPSTDLGGSSGWPSVLTLAKFFRENGASEIRVFCVLDRDYHLPDEIEKWAHQAKEENIHLVVWSAKELENYAIVPDAISRLVTARGKKPLSPTETAAKIQEFVDAMRDATFDSFAESFRHIKPSGGTTVANKAAREYLSKNWTDHSGWNIVCGKTLLSKICNWIQQEYEMSISISLMISALYPSEVHNDVIKLFNSLDVVN